ncbi:MAG: L,D-transpeptidase [Longimicrobiales bacterium]
MRPTSLLLAATSVAAVGVLSGWALLDPGPPPDDAPVAAALRAARLAGAPLHAPATFALAEDAYARGLQERRRQELRFRAVRDYSSARRHLDHAAARAGAAGEVTERRTARLRRDAVRVVTEAQVVLEGLAGVESRVWLPEAARRELGRARLNAHEAAGLLAAERPDDATARASAALVGARSVRATVFGEVARFVGDAERATWAGWVRETVAWSARTGKAAVVVDKDRHRMVLYEAGRATRTFDIDLGWSPARDKLHQGDGATPEGRYRISQKKGRGQSRYHRALLLDYPNASDLQDLAAARRAGRVAPGVPAGGLIEIHGEGGRGRDWTDGCVAVTNPEMDDLFRRVEVGTPVTVVGSLGEGTFSALARRLR